MFSPRVRALLAAVSFAFGCYQVVSGHYVGLVFFAVAAFLAYGYFKYGTVWLAFRAVARGEMEGAAKLLAQVRKPEALGAQDRGYYELASGFVCASRGQNERAEAHLRAALAHELRTDNDRALAEAVLAQLLIARDEMVEARKLLERAVGRDSRPAIAARIRAIQSELPSAPAT